jgi:hypothetical protein
MCTGDGTRAPGMLAKCSPLSYIISPPIQFLTLISAISQKPALLGWWSGSNGKSICLKASINPKFKTPLPKKKKKKKKKRQDLLICQMSKTKACWRYSNLPEVKTV